MARIRLIRPETIRRRLPPVCMKCGARADVYVVRTFAWYPQWVIVFLLVSCLSVVFLVVWFIVAMITAKRMTVDAPMCNEHRNHWRNRALFTWFGFGVVAACGVVLLIANIVNDRDDPNALAGGMNAFIWIVSFVVYLFAAGIYTQSAIRPFEITEDDITLGKVSPDFVEALEDDRDRYEEERRERRRRDRDADRDERDD